MRFPSLFLLALAGVIVLSLPLISHGAMTAPDPSVRSDWRGGAAYVQADPATAVPASPAIVRIPGIPESERFDAGKATIAELMARLQDLMRHTEELLARLRSS